MSMKQCMQQGLGIGIGVAIVLAIVGGGCAPKQSADDKASQPTATAAPSPAPPATQPAAQPALSDSDKKLLEEVGKEKRKELSEIMADLTIYMADGHDQWPDKLDVATLGPYMKTTEGSIVDTMAEIQYQKPSTSQAKTPKHTILGRLPLADGSYYTFDSDDSLDFHPKK